VTNDAHMHSRRVPLMAAIAATLVVTLGACGSDPFAIKWVEAPDTVLLYSLARPELNLAAGFNFQARSTIRVEAATATGTWDFALDTRDDQLVFLPPGALGVASKARVTALPGMEFNDVVEAPADTTLYSAVDPVPVQLGTIYVFRTGQSVGAFRTRCVYYAKLEPLIVDVAGGTLTFVFDGSPVCNNRSLIPPN